MNGSKWMLSAAAMMTVLTLAYSKGEAAFFDLLSTDALTALDGQASADFTVGGITATLAASSGVLNGTASNFGIDGTGADETTSIDDDVADEVLTITFDQDVYFVSFVVQGGSGTTDAGYTVGSASLVTVDFPTGGYATPETISVAALPGILLTAGSAFTIQQDAGGTGFSFEGFTANLVPEPASLCLIGAGLLLMATRRRPA